MTVFEMLIMLIALILAGILAVALQVANTLIQIRETLIAIKRRTPVPPSPARERRPGGG